MQLIQTTTVSDKELKNSVAKVTEMLIKDHSKTTLKFEAAISSKMLVLTYQSKWCYVPYH